MRLVILVIKILLVFFGLVRAPFVIAAESPVEFSWEKIEGAVAYDVLVEERVESDWIEIKTEKLEEPSFQGTLFPGTYRIKVRTYDKRQVAGDWSEYYPLVIKWPQIPLVVEGINGDELELSGVRSGLCRVKWEVESRSGGYEIQISSSKDKKNIIARLDKELDQYQFEAEAGITYTAEVILLDRASKLGQKGQKTITFKALGKRWETPSIVRRKTDYPDKIEFTKSAGKVTYSLYFKSIFSSSFEEIVRARKLNKSEIKIGDAAGLYQIRAIQTGLNRKQSDVMVEYIEKGDKSLGLSYKALLSIIAAKNGNRFSLWGEVRYSNLDYRNFSSSNNLETDFIAQTLGLRLGGSASFTRSLGTEFNITFDGVSYETRDELYLTSSLFLTYGESLSLGTDYKFGLGLRYAMIPLIFASPIQSIETQYINVDYLSASLKMELSFHVYKDVSARFELYGWFPLGGMDFDEITNLKNKGYFAQFKGYYSFANSSLLLFGLGYQFDRTDYSDDFGELSSFPGDESFSEVSQVHLSLGWQLSF